MTVLSNLVLLSGQLSVSQAMDVVANNIANASTVGFKREGMAFEAYMKPTERGSKNPTQFAYDRATYRDASSGTIVNTGNPLDLAIQGHGYFRVQMPDGSTTYTRAGTFKLNTEGVMVTTGGQPILGDGGTILIPNTASEINISEDGFVTARVDNGNALAQIGKITLAKFDNEQQMQALGGGLYSTKQQPQQDTDSSIKQGSVEQSNVQPILEITDMIRIMRSYEQASNMISNENQRESDAVTRLAKVS